MKSVTVLIPTFQRPESLARALKSVFAQDRPELIGEIVVVDNDPDGTARPTVDALRRSCATPLLYVHALPPGVATARNAGLAASNAPYVAFLDDDEQADANWLGALYHAHRRFDADVTFGPVQGSAPAAAAWKRPYLERFFSRTGPNASGLTGDVYGCGNSMMTRATALKGPEPFDVAANHTGGEDDILFSHLKTKDARFAWAADARVVEHAPEHRAKLSYALARAVSYGQSPSQLALRRGDFFGVAKWTVIGVGQALIYSALSLVMVLIRNPNWLDRLDRAARGLGKTLWLSHFQFYGEGAAKRNSTTGNAERDGVASFAATATNITQIKSL
jgi:cellulose synthase/poly-beta-1,6-N-acetylglucosamine synthase-like glycosyltransferase